MDNARYWSIGFSGFFFFEGVTCLLYLLYILLHHFFYCEQLFMWVFDLSFFFFIHWTKDTPRRTQNTFICACVKKISVSCCCSRFNQRISIFTELTLFRLFYLLMFLRNKCEFSIVVVAYNDNNCFIEHDAYRTWYYILNYKHKNVWHKMRTTYKNVSYRQLNILDKKVFVTLCLSLSFLCCRGDSSKVMLL